MTLEKTIIKAVSLIALTVGVLGVQEKFNERTNLAQIYLNKQQQITKKEIKESYDFADKNLSKKKLFLGYSMIALGGYGLFIKEDKKE